MRFGRRGAVLVLLALVAISTGRALGNGFAFDDVPMIVDNTQVHQLASPLEYAKQSYWPPRNLGDAYRPWTVWWFAIQYAMAGPAPLVFHALNLILTAVVTLLVFALALETLPFWAAFAGAAIFAVHPVHVEATANVVGQAELWMTLFVVAAVLVYARARRTGMPGMRERLVMGALYVLAAASKEQGIFLPGVLVAWELCITRIHDERPLGRRLRGVAPSYAFLALVGVTFVVGRYAVLGDLGGGPAAAGLARLAWYERIGVMLPMVGEWLRLFVWPHHLLAQYSPPGHGATGWSTMAFVGLVLIGAVAAAAYAARRVQPAITVGILWIGITLFPVANVAFPTGVLIAERTLLLPSVGVALALGGVLQLVLAGSRSPKPQQWGPPPGLGRRLAHAGVIAAAVGAIALGAFRSWTRQAVWKDNDTLFKQTVADGPRSYRAYFVYGRDLMGRKQNALAKEMFAKAGELYGGDRRVFEDWGFMLRAEGRCDLAVPVLERGVDAVPEETVARSRLFECLLTLHRYEDALRVAEAGVMLGGKEFENSVERARKLVQSR